MKHLAVRTMGQFRACVRFRGVSKGSSRLELWRRCLASIAHRRSALNSKKRHLHSLQAELEDPDRRDRHRGAGKLKAIRGCEEGGVATLRGHDLQNCNLKGRLGEKQRMGTGSGTWSGEHAGLAFAQCGIGKTHGELENCITRYCRCVGGDEKRLCDLKASVTEEKGFDTAQGNKEGATLPSFCDSNFAL